KKGGKMMSKRMKIIIAYDGSSYSDAAIEDLRRSGLPQEGDAVIISVADISKTSIPSSDEICVLGKHVSTRLLEETVALTQREKASARNKAIKLAIRGGRGVLENLPGWRVKNQIAVGNPAEELLRMADEFKPDLIVVGSHGRSAIGRFFLGSVSQKVAEGANCSVRIGRQGSEKRMGAQNKVIIGASSLPDAEEVIRAVSRRAWAEDTEIRLIVSDNGISAGRVSAVYPYAKAIFEQSVEVLRATTGAQVSVAIRSGETESILLEEAENWKADSIFLVNEREIEEKGLGKLAANLLTGAKCTVEIVR
ncbi:MAG TPA: universal stress protein, partial [Pyrinomonadaceae bacterium]|nr:universal stress protein [Pyrinomonadaceae bacterium]